MVRRFQGEDGRNGITQTGSTPFTWLVCARPGPRTVLSTGRGFGMLTHSHLSLRHCERIATPSRDTPGTGVPLPPQRPPEREFVSVESRRGLGRVWAREAPRLALRGVSLSSRFASPSCPGKGWSKTGRGPHSGAVTSAVFGCLCK